MGHVRCLIFAGMTGALRKLNGSGTRLRFLCYGTPGGVLILNTRRSYHHPLRLLILIHANSRGLSRVWELSQNIDRFTDTTPFGITGCITPTGVPYVTIRGGPMIGLEALAMQGLPIERLLLTREHQRQLQDLAGNAMSTTVVG